ncbi:hypothetical protein [Enterovibrio nigricans]|uniref:Uncharacterized protein n=1 Tax=Enterovibrio nigricans DSM 22720 TaxID=1121868 RepID=A0A1T4UQY3_9GAMM|nr:hypothetical protein [Enterovibrio nigricans]PKF50668.1 hypothetical protein AT251_09820 [Enterovibrio nigricans]SKA55109.1 hypothetical protein SAMN02745132_02274 [Enterovibrio nigricans DSM 22720]
MSDVPSAAIEVAATAQTAAESSGSIWPYVVGGIALVVAAGYWGFKRMNKPTFIINQIRKRNLKAMKKAGIESNEATVDLDKLLTAIEEHANTKNLTGADMLKLLNPLNDKGRMQTAKDMYTTMQHIAREIGNTKLAGEFKGKSSGVKSNSRLMAGLFKRAGI